jgi:hypothetical protein
VPPAKTKPEKMQAAKPASAKLAAAQSQEKKTRQSAKLKTQKNIKVCKTGADQDSRKAAKATKTSTKVAKKAGHQNVIRATTLPIE